MSPNDRAGPRRARPGTPELLLRAVLFVVIVVAAVIAVIRADAWWTSLLAAAGVAVGAVGVAMVAFALLADEGDAEPEEDAGRTASVALGAVAAVLIVLALVVPEHEAKEYRQHGGDRRVGRGDAAPVPLGGDRRRQPVSGVSVPDDRPAGDARPPGRRDILPPGTHRRLAIA